MKRVSKTLGMAALLGVGLWLLSDIVSSSSAQAECDKHQETHDHLNSEYSFIKTIGDDPSKVVTTDMGEVNVLLKDESVTDVYYVDLDLLKMIM